MELQKNNTLRRETAPFTMVANSLLNDKTISLAAKGLYAFMCSKPDNWNFTIRSMAKQLKEGQTAIGNYLRELREHGWLEYVKNSDGTGVYKIKAAIDSEPKPENPNLGLCNMQKPTRISNTNLCNKKDSKAADKSANVNLVESAFDIYWQAGMRKVGKKNALQAFKAAVRDGKHDPVEFATMLATDVKNRLGKQFGFDSMHPTTYLRNERWTDELEQQGGGGAIATTGDWV